MRRAIPLFLLVMGGCSHAADRYARNFLEWDARSDAENGAGARCSNNYRLLPGRKGYLSEDYECLLTQQNNAKVSGSAPPHGLSLPILGHCSPSSACPTRAEILAAAREWDGIQVAAMGAALDEGTGTLHMAYQPAIAVRRVHCGRLLANTPPSVNCRLTMIYRGRSPSRLSAQFVCDNGIWRMIAS